MVIHFTSTVDQFELLRTLAGGIVCLARFRAAVENVDALGGFFPAVGFWTWETAVTGHHTTEPSLTPAQLGSPPFLDALHGVEGVLASRRAVSLDLTGSLHHKNT